MKQWLVIGLSLLIGSWPALPGRATTTADSDAATTSSVSSSTQLSTDSGAVSTSDATESSQTTKSDHTAESSTATTSAEETTSSSDQSSSASHDESSSSASSSSSQSESKVGQLKLTPTTTALTVTDGQSTELTGTVQVPKQSLNQKVVIHPTINGTTATTVTVTATTTKVPFTVTVPASSLQVGDNQVTLAATSEQVEAAPTTAVQINVMTVPDSGSISYTQSVGALAFGQVTLTGASQLIKRSGDWHLIVNDDRTTTTGWVLSAEATSLTTSDGQQLAGGLVYRQGGQETSLTNQAVEVAKSTATTYNVESHWTSDTGILLRLNAGARAGDYAGQLTWTLTSAPE